MIAYGITVGVQDHGAALAGWRIIFLVTGLATVALGGWFWAVVPDSQLDARWLRGKSEGGDGEKGGEDEIDERAMAVERVRVNGQGIGNRQYKPYQLREAMTDPMTWAFALYALLADIPNGGLTNFFSQLVSFPSTITTKACQLTATDCLLWLYARSVPFVRHSWRCCRSHLPPGLRFPGRLYRPAPPVLRWRPARLARRRHSAARPTARHQFGEYRPLAWLLLDDGLAGAVHRPAFYGLGQCGRIYEEDDCCCHLPGGILCGQHHRTPDIPAAGRAALRAR